jgi:hypothetical protein
MKQKLFILLLILVAFGVPAAIAINCGDTWQPNGATTSDSLKCEGHIGVKMPYTVTVPWTIFWVDSVQGRNVIIQATGECADLAPTDTYIQFARRSITHHIGLLITLGWVFGISKPEIISLTRVRRLADPGPAPVHMSTRISSTVTVAPQYHS